VSERASLLVREEIELVKAEVAEKAGKLGRGAVVGIAAGLFLSIGVLFLGHMVAFLLGRVVFDGRIWLGYAVVAGLLFVLGAVAGLLAARAMKAGAPPTPTIAIDEARKIRETFEAPTAAEAAPNR